MRMLQRSAWMKPLSAAAALVAGCLGTASPTSAAEAQDCRWVWSSPELVNEPGPLLSPVARIGLDDAGWAIVAWSEMDASYNEQILVSRRPPGGHWGAPQLIARTQSHTGSFSTIDLAVGASGHAMLAWFRPVPQSLEEGPQVAHFDPGAGWTEPQDLAVPGHETDVASVAINASGVGIVSWPASGLVFTRFYRPGQGWSDVGHIGDPRLGGLPLQTRSVINDAGDAAVGWVGWQPTVARYDHVAGAWQPLTRLFDRGRVKGSLAPELSMTPMGDVFAVWLEKPSGDTRTRVFSARYAAGQGWAPAQRLTGQSYGGWQPAVTTNAQGEALVSWRVKSFPKQRLEVVRYVPGRGWGAPQRGLTKYAFDHSLPSFQANGEFAVMTHQQDWGDEPVSVVVTYTGAAGSDHLARDAVDGLGPLVYLGSGPNGRLAAAGTEHVSFPNGSKGALRASVRERRCATPAD